MNIKYIAILLFASLGIILVLNKENTPDNTKNNQTVYSNGLVLAKIDRLDRSFYSKEAAENGLDIILKIKKEEKNSMTDKPSSDFINYMNFGIEKDILLVNKDGSRILPVAFHNEGIDIVDGYYRLLLSYDLGIYNSTSEVQTILIKSTKIGFLELESPSKTNA